VGVLGPHRPACVTQIGKPSFGSLATVISLPNRVPRHPPTHLT
jgi:hypothetical protein